MNPRSDPPRRQLFTPPMTRIEATIVAVFYVGLALGAVQLLLMTIEDIGVARVLTWAAAIVAWVPGMLVFFFCGLWCTDAFGEYERTPREHRTWRALFGAIGYAVLALFGLAEVLVVGLIASEWTSA